MTTIFETTASTIPTTSTESAYFFVIGNGKYKTNPIFLQQQESPSIMPRCSSSPISKFNPEFYYPNACLFCGLPNGQLISSSTNQNIMITTTAAAVIPTNAPITTNTARKMLHDETEQRLVTKKRVLPTAEAATNKTRTTARTLGSMLRRIKFTFKKFIIRKQIYLFSTMMNNKKRFFVS